MFGLDDSSAIGVNVAVAVAVIFTIMFVLALLCGVLGLVMLLEGGFIDAAGHEAMLLLA